MLRVCAVSGSEVAALGIEELEVPDVRSLKRHLHKLLGTPRFRQRLFCEGRSMEEDETLDAPADIQLVLLPFIQTSQAQERELMNVAFKGDELQMEQILQRPQEPRVYGSFGPGAQPLQTACGKGHLNIARLLLEAGANCVEIWGAFCPFAEAVFQNRVDEEILRLLVKTSCSSNSKFLEGTGSTLLHEACTRGYVPMARVLLEAGINREKVFRGVTPLGIACLKGHPDIVRLLLDFNADKDKLCGGDTPLGLVSGKQDEESLAIEQLLLEAGAQKEFASKTPLHPAFIASGQIGHWKPSGSVSGATP